MQQEQFPVVVVGGGPVGLALSNELGHRGVRHLLVERGRGDIHFPAGEGIFSRTMEHLRRWDLAARVRHHPGFPEDRPLNVVFATALAGRQVALFEAVSNGRMPDASPDSPEGIMICPKQVFDPVLREGAAAHAATTHRYETELLAFTEHEDHVALRLRDLASGKEYAVSTRYLAACDGARSMVRKALDIPFIGTFGEGRNFAVHFRAPALDAVLQQRFGRPVFQLHTINTPHRPYVTSVNGRDEWRLSMYIESGDDPEPAAAVAQAVGQPLEVQVLRAQPWSGHRVVAERYGTRRVHLLGDAAHLRWPKGGFGANTGIGDAVDFGWKVAAVVQGWAPPGLLKSYEAERRPIAVRNVNEAANNRVLDAMVQPDPVLDEDSPRGGEQRRVLECRLHALRLREFRTQGIQLGYRYRGSPVCVDDGSLEPPDDHMVYQPSTWPGCRAPHAWLAPGRSTLDCYGKGFVLVRCDGGAPSSPFAQAAAARGLPLAELRLDTPELRRLYERRYVLVRPDGHVAWRGDAWPADADAVLDRVTGAHL